MNNSNAFLDKKSKFHIAVDGEAASGKGTLCKKLAEEFNLFYCGTSIFYRKLARIAIDNNIEDIEILQNIARDSERLTAISEKQIYTEEVSQKTSEIAAISKIREALNVPQREVLKTHLRVIMEGRDIGTIIAPNADIKLYITASIEERAKRRFAELAQKEPGLTLEKVQYDLMARDKRDKERKDAPLVIADDAIILDSSIMNAEEFYQAAIKAILYKMRSLTD